jgi:Fe-S cluster assembly protein SufD
MKKPLINVKSQKGVEKPAAIFPFSRKSLVLDGLPTEIKEYHLSAWSAFEAQSFPSFREDNWRRSNFRDLQLADYQSTETIEPITRGDFNSFFKGGQFAGMAIISKNSSAFEKQLNIDHQKIIFTDLLAAEQDYPELVGRVLGKVILSSEGKYESLISALGRSGVFLYIPKKTHVVLPIKEVLCASGTMDTNFSHNIIFLDEGSSAQFILEETSSQKSDKGGFHGGLNEIKLEKGARLDFIHHQNYSRKEWDFSHTRAVLAADAQIQWLFGATGSISSKGFMDIVLEGKGSTARFSGLYLANGKQRLDYNTMQKHLAAHTTSDLIYKGVLLEESRSIWKGMIHVSPKAKGTDGYQANRNLILSKKARADSIPGLEILTDDVKCSHGATVGKIDPMQLFYLMSRGLSFVEAEHLIIEGFLMEVLDRVPMENQRLSMLNLITEKLMDSKTT